MHHLSPACGCGWYLMRYATGSQKHGRGSCMSIFMRSVAAPAAKHDRASVT
jgi:hypothetical protein